MERSAAARKGIELSFTDALGRHREISDEVLKEFLLAIPDRPAHPLLPDHLIISGEAHLLEFSGQPGVVEWQLTDDRGLTVGSGRTCDGPALIAAPADGVYTLKARTLDGVEDETTVLSVSPPAWQGGFERRWILAVQLYGIRSRRNWGIGDFTDLADVMRWAAAAGAAGVGLNPLHALFDDEPAVCSPYSPNSRHFLNPVYIDVEKVSGHRPSVSESPLTDLLSSLRARDSIDYVAVADLKQRTLRDAFVNFSTSDHDSEDRWRFAEFRKTEGKRLRDFACFEVLRGLNAGPWWEWSAEWSAPDDARLAAFRRGDHANEIEFVEFLQWCAHEQLQACCDLDRELAMPVGLYLDVAVGVRADGFDAWYEQMAISRALSVGAPPDILNTAGQDWGLAGFNASGLAARMFQPFRDMIAASMRYAGAIRLDHVLGLNRLYLTPRGYRPDQGAYVRMPLEMLLGLVALESRAHRCVVIGEDLGTVPEGFRERLADWGIWSYRVVMFEREWAKTPAGFIAPEDYPAMSLATFSTHDLATFAGWLSAGDIKVKAALGLDPGETEAQRSDAIRLFAQMMDERMSIYDAVGFMARTPSKLLSVAIEDLFGVIEQANVPGTVDEHPNWRRKLPGPIEGWNGQIDVARLRRALAARNISSVKSWTCKS